MMGVRVGSRRVVVTAVASVVLALIGQPTGADLIKDTDTKALSQGFGNVPRLLTVQRTGMTTSPEAACNSISGGALVQTCGGADATISEARLTMLFLVVSPEGVTVPSAPGNELVNPLGTIVGITNASQIRLNYNPSETGSNPQTDIQDIMLKFFSTNIGNPAVVASVDGGCGNACTSTATDPLFFGDTGTNLGNGGVGFILKLTDAQAAALNAACGANMVGCGFVTAETTILLSDDGPDSFTLFSSTLAVPEPSSLLLLGAGLGG